MHNLTKMKELQLDYKSEFGLTILQYLKDYEKAYDDLGLSRAIKLLKNWDGVESKESIGALLFHSFIRNLTINLYNDEFELLEKDF